MFFGSCLALLVIGMTFAIRGDIVGAVGAEFSLSKEQLGWMASAAFWGYTGRPHDLTARVFALVHRHVS
jgi:hypothetical protein